MSRALSSLRPSGASLRTISNVQLLSGLCLLLVLARMALIVIYYPYREGDTEILVRGVPFIRACLRAGRLSGCAFDGPFPLYQYLPSLILSYLGRTDAFIFHTLAYLNFLAFAASLVLIFRTLKRTASEHLAVAGLIVMLTGPLLWYSRSTYGEMLAAFLILSFTSASLLKARGPVVVALFVLAAITKEIAFPFLLVIGLLSLLPELLVHPLLQKRRVAHLLLGAALAIIINLAFNYFRYKTFYNPVYLSEITIVPTWKLQFTFFMGMWLSPNAGLSFFWPSFVFLYLALVVAVLYGGAEVNPPAQRILLYAPLLVVSGILLLLTVGFSRWITPYGGAAWGPRYMLPWIPALLLLLLHFYAGQVTAVLSLLFERPLRFALVCLALLVVSLPQFAVLFDADILGALFAPSPECPHWPIIQESVGGYYHCLKAMTWPSRFNQLSAIPVIFRPRVIWFAICYAGALVGGCLWIRRGLERDAGARLASHLRDRLDSLVSWLMPQSPLAHVLLVTLFYLLLFTALFSSVIFSGAFLAPGDGFSYHLAYFYSSKGLWDDLLLSGSPMFADPQVMMWYPLALLFSHVPDGWNIFVLLAYLAASCFTYGYVHTITGSRLSALVSGIVYGMCGFMIVHLAHTAIIHSAAWLPLIIWSLEMLRRRPRPFWFAVGVIAISCCFLAGHTQIFVYSLITTGGYVAVMGWTAPAGRWRFYSLSVLVLLLGLGLAAIQIIPTIELARLSARADYSFTDFVTYSFPPGQFPLLIFPRMFGGLCDFGEYWGDWNLTELTGYVGLLPPMLAAIGLAATRQKRLALFWLGAGLFAFLMALGQETPLARLAYLLPVVKQFRAPARHFFELAFATSVLAGLGVAAIQRGEAKTRLVWKTVAYGALFVFSVLLLFSSYLKEFAAERGITDLRLIPWANRAVGVPFLLLLLGGLTLLFWHRRPALPLRTLLLVVVLTLDLATFARSYEWRCASPLKSTLTLPAAEIFRQQLAEDHQRIVAVSGVMGSPGELRPNINRLWGVPSATGYGPLTLPRVSQMLSINVAGGVGEAWRRADDQSFNLMAVRYFFLPGTSTARYGHNAIWAEDDLGLWLGSGCDHPPLDVTKFDLPKPVRATGLGVVSRLACSVGVAQGTEVVRVLLTDTAGNVYTESLVAGRDTSEWAYDCRTIKPNMRHGRAAVFDDYPTRMQNEPCQGHRYLAFLDLKGEREIKSVEFRWAGSPPAALILEKATLINEATRNSQPVGSSALQNREWRSVENRSDATIYENPSIMPRAWLVPEVITLRPDEALTAIKTSRLPDGRVFEPGRIALVEEQISLSSPGADNAGSARIVNLSSSAMEIETSSAAPAFLLTGDVYYPGWQASVDGSPVRIVQADYVLRGLLLPAGNHTVKFVFRPRSFYYGLVVSFASLLVLAAFLLKFSRLTGVKWPVDSA